MRTRSNQPDAAQAVALAFSAGEGGHEFALMREFGRTALREIGVAVAPAFPDDEGAPRPVSVVAR